MIAHWWRNWRRGRILGKPFPDEWEAVLERNVRQYPLLPVDAQQRLRACVQVVVQEKYWEGCAGFVITDEVRVTIAGQASLLLLGWDNEYFDHIKSVLVYPETYMAPTQQTLPGGVVVESMAGRLGESWYRGPVILAWNSINTHDNPGEPGHNVVLHEFAHVLDQDDEFFDGTPELGSPERYNTWRKVMSREFRKLTHAAERGRATLLDQYGTESEAEFFAVATECFFERPAALRDRHTRLYNLLHDYFRQDPAEWGID